MTFQEDNFSLDEPTDDPLELAVRAMKQESIPAGPSAETIAATLKALESQEHRAQRTILSIPRSRMMRLVKTSSGVLLAGCVAIAVLTLRSPASAYSQVIEQAKKAKSMSYVETISTSILPTAVVRTYVAEDGRTRTEHIRDGKPIGMVSIMDASGYVRLTLIDHGRLLPPKADLPMTFRKSALVHAARQPARSIKGGWRNSWLQSLQALKDQPEKELGEKQLDGKTVRGFEAKIAWTRFQMWVDVATGLPVQIDYDTALGQHVTMTDFKFNEQLDESLFSFEPPADYEVRTSPTAPAAVGGEESVIVALCGYTAKSEGEFPASLTEWGEWTTRFTKGNTTGVPDKEMLRIMANLGAITPFLTGMDPADYAYRGKGKTTQDKDAIVFWYKKPDGTYRAIYGDLTVKEIQAPDVPKD